MLSREIAKNQIDDRISAADRARKATSVGRRNGTRRAATRARSGWAGLFGALRPRLQPSVRIMRPAI